MNKRLTLAALLAITSGTAFAALPSFESMDVDGDGQISREEAAKSEELLTAFVAADEDKDGKLSPEEYKAIK